MAQFHTRIFWLKKQSAMIERFVGQDLSGSPGYVRPAGIFTLATFGSSRDADLRMMVFVVS
jgi:hypothetical protein